MSFQPGNVETIEFGPFPCSHGVGWDVLGYPRQTADDAVRTDSDKLVCSRQPSENGMILDLDVTTQGGPV